MNRKHTALAALAAASLALTACSAVEAADAPPPSSSDVTPSPWTPSEPEPTAEELEEVPDDLGPVIASFGEDWTYEDGITVKVSDPVAFTPSEYAAGGENHQHHVKFTVTLTNGSTAALDPTLAFDSVSSGGGEGDAVFDDGLDGSPMTTLIPGRSVSYDVGYGVADPSDIVFEMSPTWDHEPAIFTTDGGEQA